MNYKSSGNPLRFIPWYILLLIFVTIIMLRCKWLPGNKNNMNQEKKESVISWNILFEPGTDKASRDKMLKNLLVYVKDFYDSVNTARGTSFSPPDSVTYCPCDTLLYNFDFPSLFGAGPSVTTAPSKARTAGSGEPVVSNNIAVIEPVRNNPDIIDRLKNRKDTVSIKPFPIDTANRLAIIDSGIDSSFFSAGFKNLIWKDPTGAATIYNFLPGQPLNDRFDQTTEKHGTAVAAIALKAMEKMAAKYSKVMVLKALDKNNSGSIFSVSCALSYAIQKNATVVNLSLGYYGAPDSVLHHYLALSKTSNPSIHVFAAAGNTLEKHTADLCTLAPNNNLLNAPRPLFYPACFGPDLSNITSVTQISREDSACFYQNYSNHFVNLGIHDKTNCCATKVDFLPAFIKFYEGSSFVTPVASGLRMGSILKQGNISVNTAWESLIQSAPLKKIVVNGNYIVYSP